mgnify:CR=1 FL=1
MVFGFGRLPAGGGPEHRREDVARDRQHQAHHDLLQGRQQGRQRCAVAAIDEGRFTEEIAPITVTKRDGTVVEFAPGTSLRAKGAAIESRAASR